MSAKIAVGIDIGSRTAKGVLLKDDTVFTAIIPTGLHMQPTADEILGELLEKSGVDYSQIDYIVGTGYGRVSLIYENIPHEIVTEISCHAMGAHHLHPKTCTLIDIGGQDSKAIKVDPATGKVLDFIINDKCAAGTGKFLEMVASSLSLQLDELGGVALESTNPSQISSQCIVFAESEIISLKARGDLREDVAAGVHGAVARRVCNLLNRVGIESDIVFTGGVAKNVGMRRSLEEHLGMPFAELSMDAIYAGALGAALFARQFSLSQESRAVRIEAAPEEVELKDFEEKIHQRQESIINSDLQGKKVVGYLCTYIPVELFHAAGVVPIRLYKGGNDQVAASGEIHTRSFFCQFTQTCIGSFREKDPLYTAVDKIYTFNTCDQMKKTAEAIYEFYKVPVQIFCLPRERHREAALNFYHTEIKAFKEDLEDLIGKRISDEDIYRQIKLHNQIRQVLRDISELRKRSAPPITGREFLILTRCYFYLPPEELLGFYQEIYQRMLSKPDLDGDRIRLMMSGGIIAEGDEKLIRLIEDEVGALVVVEGHCTGLRHFYCQVPEDGDPLRSLAQGYLHKAPCTRTKPLKDRLEFATQLAQEYQVEGVVHSYLKFCTCYGISKNSFVSNFKKLDLPVLELSNDYSRSDIGQLKTRIEAFVEVLERKKEVRI
jgi:predicted CoA-substrate-specific enzyme activase